MYAAGLQSLGLLYDPRPAFGIRQRIDRYQAQFTRLRRALGKSPGPKEPTSSVSKLPAAEKGFRESIQPIQQLGYMGVGDWGSSVAPPNRPWILGGPQRGTGTRMIKGLKFWIDLPGPPTREGPDVTMRMVDNRPKRLIGADRTPQTPSVPIQAQQSPAPTIPVKQPKVTPQIPVLAQAKAKIVGAPLRTMYTQLPIEVVRQGGGPYHANDDFDNSAYSMRYSTWG